MHKILQKGRKPLKKFKQETEAEDGEDIEDEEKLGGPWGSESWGTNLRVTSTRLSDGGALVITQPQSMATEQTVLLSLLSTGPEPPVSLCRISQFS